MEDVASEVPEFWIRSTLFEEFPRLLEFERGRRPTAQGCACTLREGGFKNVRMLTYVETRQCYPSFGELAADILARKGKSIRFELSDSELERYCDRLELKAPGESIREVDQWTVWLAAK